MADTKTKDFNEYLLENVKAVREETRDFKNDLTKRMDGLEKHMDRIENRMDKLDEKIDKLSEKLDTSMKEMRTEINSSLKEIRELVASSQKDIHALERYNSFLTSALVSAFVTTILCVLLHGKGL